MSSLWNLSVTRKPKIYKKPSPAYQSDQFVKKSLARDSDFQKNIKKYDSIKGISLLICAIFKRCNIKGSMTVEAAAVLPLLLFFFINLTSAIEMIRLHGNLELALWETGRRIAMYEYAIENIGSSLQIGEHKQDSSSILASLPGTILTSAYARNEVIRYSGETYLNNSPLTYGAEGLNFLESVFRREEDRIDLVVTYQVSAWAEIPGFSAFRMTNRYYGKAWTGYRIPGSENSIEEDFVYVTEFGNVYHETQECSYIKRTIRGVSRGEVLLICNDRGKAYTLCWLCRDAIQGSKVFITPDGIRYHYSEKCSGLKRTVQKVQREEAAKKYRPCSRCAV